MTTDSSFSLTTERGSCIGCRFLITRDTGYSNWTVEDTEAHCVLDKNFHLPAYLPDDIRGYKTDYKWVKPEHDRWFATKDQRCDSYQYTTEDYPTLDVDGEKIMTIKQAEDHFFKTGDGMPLRIARYFKQDYVDYHDKNS